MPRKTAAASTRTFAPAAAFLAGEAQRGVDGDQGQQDEETDLHAPQGPPQQREAGGHGQNGQEAGHRVARPREQADGRAGLQSRGPDDHETEAHHREDHGVPRQPQPVQEGHDEGPTQVRHPFGPGRSGEPHQLAGFGERAGVGHRDHDVVEQRPVQAAVGTAPRPFPQDHQGQGQRRQEAGEQRPAGRPAGPAAPGPGRIRGRFERDVSRRGPVQHPLRSLSHDLDPPWPARTGGRTSCRRPSGAGEACRAHPSVPGGGPG